MEHSAHEETRARQTGVPVEQLQLEQKLAELRPQLEQVKELLLSLPEQAQETEGWANYWNSVNQLLDPSYEPR